MSAIYFLEAEMPLCKKYELNANGLLIKHSYPSAYLFKSHKETVTTINTLYTKINEHALKGHCVIKGRLKHELDWIPRKESTSSTDTTNWLCFDLDGAPFTSPEEFMNGHDMLRDVSYVVQYSASHGLGEPGMRAHIFVMLDGEHNVGYIKSWLMELNLDGTLWGGKVRKAIELSKMKQALSWPIDITACQNDKLIYIAPPVVGKGVKYNLSKPIQLITKKQPNIKVSSFSAQTIELWKKEQKALLNALRKEQGLETMRATRLVKGYEVQGKPGEATITGIRESDDFVYFNLNGGDSWAYYHPHSNYEFIHSFKGEPSCITSELLPAYHADCVAREKAAAVKAIKDAELPTEEGEIILGVCDKRSAAMWKISWNETTSNLQMYPANNVTQLADWAMQHGHPVAEFTPQWNFEFNPKNPIIIDRKRQYLNTYVPSPYYRDFETPAKSSKPTLDKCPTIKKVIMSMCSNNEWTDLTEHLMNWLAVAMQHKIKIGTTWVFSGTEGTGKNLFSNHIMRPLIGNRYVKEVLITGLEDQFNGWLEHCMLCFVNEIQVSSSQHRKIISGKLKNWITDSPLDIRNMGRTRYDAENYCNFMMNSNETAPVDINKGDRRYNIGDYQENKLQITEHEVKVLIPKELDAFFTYLMTRKADIEQARVILETETRRNIIAAGRNSVDMLAEALLEGDISPFIEAMPDIAAIMSYQSEDSALAVAYHTLMTRELSHLLKAPLNKAGERSTLGRLSRDELYLMFNYCIGGMPASPSKFTRLLSHKNIETKRMREENGQLIYGVNVTWTAGKAWCDEHTVPAASLRRVK